METQMASKIAEVLKELDDLPNLAMPNAWSGVDIGIADDRIPAIPNLRLADDDGDVMLHAFGEGPARILHWSARFSYYTPTTVIASAVREALLSQIRQNEVVR